MSIYLVTMQTEKTRNITFDMLMDENFDVDTWNPRLNHETDTLTRVFDSVPRKFMNSLIIRPENTIMKIKNFNDRYFDYWMPKIKEYESASEEVKKNKGNGLAYYRFYLPKKKGGWRQINAPNPEFKRVLTEARDMMDSLMIGDVKGHNASYHTSAYAYIPGRSTALHNKTHTEWGSKWFARFDFSDFFGSTTIKFVMTQMSHIFPWNIFMNFGDMVEFNGKQVHSGSVEIYKLLSLCFLNGGLPQGTPISPFLTNLMMIPFDFQMTKALHDFEMPTSKNGRDRFVYTRYADDITISCRVDFSPKVIERFITKTLKEMDAPFMVKPEKTKYGSVNGSNWVLGYMISKDGMSVGYEKHNMCKVNMYNFGKDYIEGISWDKTRLQKRLGNIEYFRRAEKEKAEAMIKKYSDMFGFNVREKMIEEIKRSGEI